VDAVAALIVFSVAIIAICVKARAVVPALVSGVLVVVLICSVASNIGIPGAVGGLVDGASADVAGAAVQK